MPFVLNIEHDTLDEMPEEYKGLYTKVGDKFVCTGIQGIKTQADIDRQQIGLDKERVDHKGTKDSLATFALLGMTPDEITAKLDRFGELEIAAEGNSEEMDAKLEAATAARVKTLMSPLERDSAKMKLELTGALDMVSALQTESNSRVITDDVMEAALSGKAGKIKEKSYADMKLLAENVFEIGADGKAITKENAFGVTPGLSADLWLQEMQETRDWWPLSVGGDAKGSSTNTSFGGKNPWSPKSWNLTEQSRVIQAQGMDKAKKMAEAAGSQVGAIKATVPAS